MNGSTRELVPPDLAFASDPCPSCDRTHRDRGCGFVLPIAAWLHGSDVDLAYRCSCGHDWAATFDLEFARTHASDSLAAIERGAPHFPMRPT